MVCSPQTFMISNLVHFKMSGILHFLFRQLMLRDISVQLNALLQSFISFLLQTLFIYNRYKSVSQCWQHNNSNKRNGRRKTPNLLKVQMSRFDGIKEIWLRIIYLSAGICASIKESRYITQIFWGFFCRLEHYFEQ